LTNKKNPSHRSRAPLPEIDPPRINWSRIISDLLNAKCPKYRIAAHIGVGVSTVQTWQRLPINSDIRYGFGRALLRLHSRYCGAALTLQRISEGDDRAYISPA
jgi:hypothetical protein